MKHDHGIRSAFTGALLLTALHAMFDSIRNHGKWDGWGYVQFIVICAAMGLVLDLFAHGFKGRKLGVLLLPVMGTAVLIGTATFFLVFGAWVFIVAWWLFWIGCAWLFQLLRHGEFSRKTILWRGLLAGTLSPMVLLGTHFLELEPDSVQEYILFLVGLACLYFIGLFAIFGVPAGEKA